MDLTLAMSGGFFNMRVAVILQRNGQLFFERFGEKLTLVGGWVKYDESIHQAAIREVDEELGVVIENPELVACIENFFVDRDVKRGFIQEYLFVFRAELDDAAVVASTIQLEMHSLAELERLPIKPDVLPEIIQSTDEQFRFYHQLDAELLPESHDDISFYFDDMQELHVRATAIIKNNAGEVLIDHQVANHPVAIGGRMQQFETIHQAMSREIKEELDATPDTMALIGIAKDFFDLNGRAIRFLSFIFKVEIDEADIHATDEIVLANYSPEYLYDLTFKLGSTKSFIEPGDDFQYILFYE